jgi:hypothetical protein
MVGEREDRVPPRSTFAARCRKALLFVGVCWSLAAALLLLQDGWGQILDLAVAHGWLPDRLVLREPTTVATDCSAAVASAQRGEADPDAARQARYLTWLLGMKTGFAAGLVDSYAGSGSEPDPGPWMEEPRRIAETLQVQAPRLPKVRHVATVLPDFAQFVAADPQCVAAQLTGRYSVSVGTLYRFGLVAGHAAVYRIRAPSLGPLYVAQLRDYGRGAGVPEDLWRPLTERSIDALPGASPQEKVLAHLERIALHLRHGG